MENIMRKRTSNSSSTCQLYEQRYAGDYMDTDDYSVWARGDLNTRKVIDALAEVQKEPENILDYGCGVGGWIELLSRIYPDAKISGVDISSTAIEKVKTKFPKYHFESFDGTGAPFSDAEFDMIFSYHVLEHVEDIEASACDIVRMLKSGGYAVIIFPCGNKGSFLERVMRRLNDSKLPTGDGRSVWFFEVGDGHLRRMTSDDTVAIFKKYGLANISQLFSGHFFGTIDWLVRGTGPTYINQVYSGRDPVGRLSAIRLDLSRRFLLGMHRLIQMKALDVKKKRNPVKQMAVHAVKQFATAIDKVLPILNALEWKLFRKRKNGAAQYLVFKKN